MSNDQKLTSETATHACRFCSRPIPERKFLENKAMTFALCFELAAGLVDRCTTITEAASGLENEALKLRRKWSDYPVKADGEREYQSWLIQLRREPALETDPLPEEIASKFANVEVCE